MNNISLAEWMRTRPKPILVKAGMGVTLATTGVHSEDVLSGIGLIPLETGEPTFIYVDGADLTQISRATPFNGITIEHWMERKVGPQRALELLAEKLQGVEFLVSHTVENFFRRWLLRDPTLNGLAGFPAFDVISYVRLHDAGEGIWPTSGNDFAELNGRVEANVAAKSGKGYGFDAVFRRVAGAEPTTEGNLFEGKLVNLRQLFNALLIV